MDDAFGAKAEPILADRDMTREAAVEILDGGLGDAGIDARTQRLADIDVLARHPKRHANA